MLIIKGRDSEIKLNLKLPHILIWFWNAIKRKSVLQGKNPSHGIVYQNHLDKCIYQTANPFLDPISNFLNNSRIEEK